MTRRTLPKAHRRPTLLVLLLGAMLALAGAAQAQRTLNLRVQSDLSTLDPAHVGQSTDHAIALLIFNGLVRYEVGGLGVVPDLATSWDISDDGLVYTFQLREGVQFHKGYGEMTADDVVFSIQRIQADETASRFRQDVGIVESVEALGPYTVQFTLSTPFSDFIPAVLAFRPGWVISQRAAEELGPDFAVSPIGTGPYQFERWSRGSEIVLSRNPDYRDPLPIQSVAFKVINDDSVAELAIRTGEVDAAYIFEGVQGLRLVEFAATSPDVEARVIPGFRTQWTTFNLARPAVQDIRVRQAIIHAIDKKAAVEAVFGELGTARSSIFHPVIPGFIDPDPFPYDPERARELLAEAGYANGLSIDVLVMPTRGWPELATIMQDMWRQVGITANLIIRERAVYDELNRGDAYDVLAQNITRASASQYAAFLYGPNIPFPNTHRYEGADDLIELANVTIDDAQREAIWGEFQRRILEEDVVGFAMSNVGYVLAWRNGVTGADLMYQDAYPVWQMEFVE